MDKTLPERQILKWTFGFYDGNRHTYTEIAKKFNITPRRIGEIVKNSLDKLKKVCRKNSIEDYLEDAETQKHGR